jgi:hypothetical protein
VAGSPGNFNEAKSPDAPQSATLVLPKEKHALRNSRAHHVGLSSGGDQQIGCVVSTCAPHTLLQVNGVIVERVKDAGYLSQCQLGQCLVVVCTATEGARTAQGIATAK